MPEFTTIPISNTKEAKPPLPKGISVKQKVRKLPINATGMTETITNDWRTDSN